MIVLKKVVVLAGVASLIALAFGAIQVARLIAGAV